jgi:transcriptional regulator with XRE-family HTH domain
MPNQQPAAKKPLFPTKLREARTAKGLSQEAASRMFGVTLVTWGRWERGESEPGMAVLEEIAEMLEVRAGWLVDGRGDPKRQDHFGGASKMIASTPAPGQTASR